MILRYGDQLKDLYILEAIGDLGVRIVSWYNLRDQLSAGESAGTGIFEKIVTRKLLFQITEKRLQDLDAFRR